ncbi:unnamed protein product [Dicrocoelium dendriticum]|nr:unnamed protein product [Dicrocoelium dendriticum]
MDFSGENIMENGRGTDPTVRIRRFSLHSKRSLDETCETLDETFLVSERKVEALQGVHVAAFSVNHAQQPLAYFTTVKLIEEQCVDCLDADNPDIWVVRVHPILTRSASLKQFRSKRSLTLPDAVQPEEIHNPSPSNSGPSIKSFKDPAAPIDVPKVGRVNAVCLTRVTKGNQRRKRDPRELFREEVITISNKQQEAKMKRRYAVTELVETEREYVKALKPLFEILGRIKSQLIVHVGKPEEETIEMPEGMHHTIQRIRDSLGSILDFSEKTLLGKLAACTTNPPIAADHFIEHADAFDSYTVYLVYIDNLVRQVTVLTGDDSNPHFALSRPSSSPVTPVDGVESTASLLSQRTTLSFKHFMELVYIPRLRITTYRSLLQDVARYTARTEESTEQLESAMTLLARVTRRAEESVILWSQLEMSDVRFPQLAKEFALTHTPWLLPPALVRLTDLETNLREDISPNPECTQSGRLVLVPTQLVFMLPKKDSGVTSSWNIAWIFKLEHLRLGDFSTMTDEPLWFDLWNVEGPDLVKTVIRVFCRSFISQNAWIEDVRCALVSTLCCDFEETHVPDATILAHEQAALQRRIQYPEEMELPDLRRESVTEIYVDAREDIQQLSFQSVESMLLQPKDMDSSIVKVLSNQLEKLDDSNSSSYHTAEEPTEEEPVSPIKESTTTLYDSYTTLDEVVTPFSEDQRSMLDEQLTAELKDDLSTEVVLADAVKKTLTVQAGEQIQFNASFTITGPIAYEVQWLFNGQPLPDDLGADMILSDWDTRLLITNAEPLIHSGTYTCRCRLFDKTETAVYFYVNVLPRSQETEDIEPEAEVAGVDELKQETDNELMELIPLKRDILHHMMSKISVPIGKILELRVGVDKEALLAMLGRTNDQINTWDLVTIQWFHKGQLLQFSQCCTMGVEDNTAILRTTTFDFLPEARSEYTCTLSFTDCDNRPQVYTESIEVEFREPTKEEIESGFVAVHSLTVPPHASLPKVVSISDLFDIQLIQGERFSLITPYDLNSTGEDTAIWWTMDGQFIAGRNVSLEDTLDFKCLLNRTNQTIKLVKPVVEKSDVGVYACWVGKEHLMDEATKCIEFVVDVLEADSDLEVPTESIDLEDDVKLEERTPELQQCDVISLETDYEEVTEDEEEWIDVVKDFGDIATSEGPWLSDDACHVGATFDKESGNEVNETPELVAANQTTAILSEEVDSREKCHDDEYSLGEITGVSQIAEPPRDNEKSKLETQEALDSEMESTERRTTRQVEDRLTDDEQDRKGSITTTEDLSLIEETEINHVVDDSEMKLSLGKPEAERSISVAVTSDTATPSERQIHHAEGKYFAKDSQTGYTDDELEVMLVTSGAEIKLPIGESHKEQMDVRIAKRDSPEEAEVKKLTEISEKIPGKCEEKQMGERIGTGVPNEKEGTQKDLAEQREMKRFVVKTEEKERTEGQEERSVAIEITKQLLAEETDNKNNAEVAIKKKLLEEAKPGLLGAKVEKKRLAKEKQKDQLVVEDEYAERMRLSGDTENKHLARDEERNPLPENGERKKLGQESEMKSLTKAAEMQGLSEEADRKRLVEEPEQRLLTEETEKQCLAEEAEEERLTEETENKRLAEEPAKIQLTEDAEKWFVDEAEEKRLTVDEKKTQVNEAKNKSMVEEVEKKRLAEHAKAKCINEEAENKRVEEEEAKERCEEEAKEQRLIKKAEKEQSADESIKQKQADETETKRLEDEREKNILAEEEGKKPLAEEAETKRLAEETAMIKEPEEEQRRMVEGTEEKWLVGVAENETFTKEAEKQRLAEDAEKKRLAKEAAKKLHAEEGEKKRPTEEATKQRLAEEVEKKRPAEETEKKRLAVETEIKRLAQEADGKGMAEEAEKRRLADEAENKRLAGEAEAERLAEEAAKKRQTEKAEKKRLAEEAEMKRLTEEAENKRLVEEAEKKRLAEEAEKKRLAEEAEKQKQSEEAEKKRLAEEAEKKRLAEEAEKKRLAEEAEKRRLAEEAEMKRLAEEAEKKRLAEEAEKKRLAEEAEKKKQAEEAEKKRLAEEAEKKRLAEEAATKKQAEELEKKRLAEEAEKQKQAEEAEKKRLAEEAEKKRLAEEAEKQKQSEEAEKKRLAEEAGKKRLAEEAEKRKQAEEAEKKRLAEEAEKKRLAEEAEKKRRAEEAEKKRLAEEAAKKKQAEEAEKKRLAEEAEMKRLAEEAEKKRLAEEAVKKRLAAEAEKQKQSEEAEKKRLAEEAEKKRLAEEAEKKRQADEAEKRRLAEEAEKKRLAEDAEKKQLAEEAEMKRLAEKAAKKKQAEKAEKKRLAEEAEKKRLAEEAEKRKQADEAEKKRLAEEAEMKRLSEEAATKLLEVEAEKQRQAEEAAMKILAKDTEKKRLMEEAEKKQAEEAVRKRLAEETEKNRLAEEKEKKKQTVKTEKGKQTKVTKKKLLAEESAKQTLEEVEDKRMVREAEKKEQAEEAEKVQLVMEAEIKKFTAEIEEKRSTDKAGKKRVKATEQRSLTEESAKELLAEEAERREVTNDAGTKRLEEEATRNIVVVKAETKLLADEEKKGLAEAENVSLSAEAEEKRVAENAKTKSLTKKSKKKGVKEEMEHERSAENTGKLQFAEEFHEKRLADDVELGRVEDESGVNRLKVEVANDTEIYGRLEMHHTSQRAEKERDISDIQMRPSSLGEPSAYLAEAEDKGRKSKKGAKSKRHRGEEKARPDDRDVTTEQTTIEHVTQESNMVASEKHDTVKADTINFGIPKYEDDMFARQLEPVSGARQFPKSDLTGERLLEELAQNKENISLATKELIMNDSATIKSRLKSDKTLRKAATVRSGKMLYSSCGKLFLEVECDKAEMANVVTQMVRNETLICIPLAEAVTLNGHVTVYADEGHSFRLCITDLPNLPLRTTWSLIDPSFQEPHVKPTDSSESALVEQADGVLQITNLREVNTGVYQAKICDPGEGDEQHALLATLDIPIRLSKERVSRHPPQPLVNEAQLESLSIEPTECTNLFGPIPEGKPVKLVAQFPTLGLDYSISDFEWMLDDQPIKAQDGMVTCDYGRHQGVVTLNMPAVRLNQSGIYSLQLSDEALERIQDAAEVSGVYISELLSNRLVFPRLCVVPVSGEQEEEGGKKQLDLGPTESSAFSQVLPSHLGAKEGEQLKIEAHLRDDIRIGQFEWLVNGKTILPEYTADYSLWRTNNSLTLMIPRARPELSGSYGLRVYSGTEVFRTQTELIVEPSRSSGSTYKPTLADGLKPLFTKRLQDFAVDVGDCVRFTARIMAEPPAIIVWRHNGNVITGEHRIRLLNDDAHPSLTISRVKPSDRGRYSCTATNSLGRADTEAILEINDTEQFAPSDESEDDHLKTGSVLTAEHYHRRSALPKSAPELSVTALDASHVSLHWTGVPHSQDLTYTVEVSKDGGKWWRPVITDLVDTYARLSTDMASPLSAVQVRVLAVNEYGVGPPSTALKIPIRACVPVMPAVKPEVEFEEAAAVFIQWQKALPSITEPQVLHNYLFTPAAMLGTVWYAVEVREGAQSQWHRVADNISSLSHSYHLTPGSSSAIRVVAVNRFGESSPTPIALAYLDPNALVPNLSIDPPWVAVSHGPNQAVGLKVYWKPAYMPEYCSSCVSGLDPFYRIEWRRGRSGMWQALADDVTDAEVGFCLPNQLVMSVWDDAKRLSDPRNVFSVQNQAIELRVFCWNKFGESGPTKSCRLLPSQLFRGQKYKTDVLAADKCQEPAVPSTESFEEMDQLPVLRADDHYLQLRSHIRSISPRDGIEITWDKFDLTDLPNGSFDTRLDTHNRYRIERLGPDPDNQDAYAWNVCSNETALIYGENFVLDARPAEVEQLFRILALRESDGHSFWMDVYNIVRIPTLKDLRPTAPTGISVQSTPASVASGTPTNIISWQPSSQHYLLTQLSSARATDSGTDDTYSNPKVRYRVEARPAFNNEATWRQVAEVSSESTHAVDRKVEPGVPLVYRVTPINLFGEGSSLMSDPVHTPLLYATLEGCVDDVRYMVAGPTDLLLRWRLGDAAIEALKQNEPSRFTESSFTDRVHFSVEVRTAYTGDWSPLVERIKGDLTAKALLRDLVYLDKDISCRVVAFLDNQRTVPSRPIRLNIKTESLVPDFSTVKPHVHVESVEEYHIGCAEPHLHDIYSSYSLSITAPHVLQRDTSYEIQIQFEGNSKWDSLVSDLEEPQWIWMNPDPLQSYHIRILPSNQFGRGVCSRAVRIDSQVVIPDLSFIKPSIEAPVDVLADTTPPELVWQLPRAYSLEKTLTPFTYEVQVRGVASTSRLAPVPSLARSTATSRTSASEDEETIWRVLETGVKRTRLALGRLDPEQEFWLRVVAVTDYGRGAPSQPVRKMADTFTRRYQRSSASVGALHEATPVSPTFIDPTCTVVYAAIGGRLELKSNLLPISYDADIRFSWLLNERPVDVDEPSYQPRLSRHRCQVSKAGDYAALIVDNLTDEDFGVYVCKAVNIRGTASKEFFVKKADAPVFLEVPVPVITVQLHSPFLLPCLVDAIPSATLYWTKDSKRIVESHRTKIGPIISTPPTGKDAKEPTITTNASLSVDRCIYQDAGLYTLVAENIAGAVQTSCLVRIEEKPVPNLINVRWTDVGKHYYVLRRLQKNEMEEVRSVIDKKTNQEYEGHMFPLDDAWSRVSGARQFECLSRMCHANVVRLVDALVSDNVLILVTERFTGPNVLEAMLYCNSWSESAAQVVIRQLVEAVKHVHSEGVVHLDIQPNNLVFASNLATDRWDEQNAYTELFRVLSPLVNDAMGHGVTDRHKMSVLSHLLKLVGFTVAEPCTEDTCPKSCCLPFRLRPEYSAPEVILAHKGDKGSGCEDVYVALGPAADMWSVGVLTYVLLTGWCPFIDPITGEVLYEHILNASYSLAMEEFNNVSDDARRFVSSLLQKNPKDRPTAAECLSSSWLCPPKGAAKIGVEYKLPNLPKYYDVYSVTKTEVRTARSSMTADYRTRFPGELQANTESFIKDSDEWGSYGLQGIHQCVRKRIRQLTTIPVHSEDSTSDVSSRASSIPNFSELMNVHDIDSDTHMSDASTFQQDNGPRVSVVSADDTSTEFNVKLYMMRQNTLTEGMLAEAESSATMELQEPPFTSETNGQASETMQRSSLMEAAMQPQISAAAPTFASPLRDAYFSIHSGEARFSCQLAGPAILPPGNYGNREVMAEVYPAQLVKTQDCQSSSATVAAWYLGGCLLSDGPGVQLGAGPGNWLWLCLSELDAEQSGSVVECVVRNRAGKARTQARLLQASPPKCPGRPGVTEIRPTEALISWVPTDHALNADMIYRVDAKCSTNQEQATWRTLGFTVDCQFLATNLRPAARYRMRVSAGNIFGWGSYSVASSEFQTPETSCAATTQLLSQADREWILTWRQSTDIYALSEHPLAVQFCMALSNSVPPPLSDKALEKLERHGGLIPDLDVLREICVPECLIAKGKFCKWIVARTNPMLTGHATSGRDHLTLPPRLLLKVTKVKDAEDPRVEQSARREGILLTGLNTSCGGPLAAVEDYFIGMEATCIFSAARHLLPCGASLGWLANDAAKPSFGINVSHWIPGGELLDVLCRRTEYSEFSIMRWTQQLLMGLRWLYSKFYGRPHGCICPRHILVSRRSSLLPDIVLAELDGERSDEEAEGFIAPELIQGGASTTYSDLWSLGAFVYLLMTGECPKLEATTQEDATGSAETTTENIKHPIEFKKLKWFSKPAKKFVYNCLQPHPRKRGHVDFWLSSRWFDIRQENVSKLTKTVIPASQVNAYRLRRQDRLDRCLSTKPTELLLLP